MTEIVESYRKWTPPIGVHAAVERLIAGTPPSHLHGVKWVVLTNTAALTGARRRRKTRARRRKVALTRCRGLYHHAWRGEPAWIEIFVNKITEPLPNLLRNSEVLLDLLVGEVFFHELGHHLHSTKAPEYADPEDVADRWSTRLLRSYFRRRHWLLFGILYVPFRVARLWRQLVSRLRRHPLGRRLRAA